MKTTSSTMSIRVPNQKIISVEEVEITKEEPEKLYFGLHNEGVVDNTLAREVWNKIGTWWDKEMGSGDIFHKNLVHPYVIKALNVKFDDHVIDIACGNGALTTAIAKIASDGQIVGVDFSKTLLDSAVNRSREEGLSNVNYYECDVTQEEDFIGLIDQLGKFSKAVCSMAIQDIEDITPLLKVVSKTLDADGCFVVSVPHPCFNSGQIVLQTDSTSSPNSNGILRNNYINLVSFNVYAKENQPLPHPHFHRPLSLLTKAFFENGFVLTDLEEPTISMSEGGDSSIPGSFLWKKFSEIPPVMILKFELRK